MNVTATRRLAGGRSPLLPGFQRRQQTGSTLLSEPDLDLTDHEGTFLALVLRVQPVTAYEVPEPRK